MSERTDQVCGDCDHAEPVPELLGQAFECREAPPLLLFLPQPGAIGAITVMYPQVARKGPACSRWKQRVPPRIGP